MVVVTKSAYGTGVGDLAHPGEVDDAGVSGCAGGDHPGPELESLRGEVIVIDHLRVLADAVMLDLKESAGEVCLVAMREVAAVGEVHRQDAVARLED